MEKYAKGPWTLGGCSGRMVYDAGGYNVADCDTLVNAQLVATAPELFEAAQAALSVLVKLCNNHTEGQHAHICNDLFNALTKAKGA